MENGIDHRLDGPAIIARNYIQFWINGTHFPKKMFAKETNHLICQVCNEFCKQECF